MVHVVHLILFLKLTEQYYVKGIHEMPQHVFSVVPRFISFILNNSRFSINFFQFISLLHSGQQNFAPIYKGANKTKLQRIRYKDNSHHNTVIFVFSVTCFG